MNAARRATRAGRNLLIALLVGALILAAIVTAYVLGRSTARPAVAPGTTAASSAPADTPAAPTGDTDAAPTGCLGGPGRNNAMLLAAQRVAPHTSYGAVEFATAFLRWAYRFPYPTSEQAKQVSKRVIAPSAAPGFKDIAGSFTSAGDITGGQVARGTTFYLSTTTGLWLVESKSTGEQVTVEVNAPYVVGGALSATKSAAIAATLVWTSSGWKVLAEKAPDTAALEAGGTQFTAGC